MSVGKKKKKKRIHTTHYSSITSPKFKEQHPAANSLIENNSEQVFDFISNSKF